MSYTGKKFYPAGEVEYYDDLGFKHTKTHFRQPKSSKTKQTITPSRRDMPLACFNGNRQFSTPNNVCPSNTSPNNA